jgi:hypothetical protein
VPNTAGTPALIDDQALLWTGQAALERGDHAVF